MGELHASIKAVHVAAVALSGGLFLTRGLLVQTGRAGWAMSAAVRYASYAIDTVLLTAALMLVTNLPAAFFANHWLAVKLALLVVYIVLGIIALRRSPTPQVSRWSFAAAVVAFVTMVGIARAHHPLGWLAIAR